MLGAMEPEAPLRSGPPRVAFLGFCDRAEVISDTHLAFQHSNLLGLRKTRVFFIFPASLAATKFAMAVFDPVVGESHKLLFKGSGGQPPFEMSMKGGISKAEMSQGASGEYRELNAGEKMRGWFFTVAEFPPEMMVLEPGEYDVLLDGEVLIDTVNILFASTPAYTPEDIAAIRSNPLAHKFIRMEVRCKECGSELRTYAGIERNAKLEKDGWQWNQDISQARFKCGCGKTDFDLKYIKAGLHGLLRPNYNALMDSSIDSVRLYENTALGEHCKAFRHLIDADPPEEKVQIFLKSHEIFFSSFSPSKLMVKKPIQGKYVLDFALLNDRHELLLIEIERPGLQLMKSDRGITAGLQHAIDQVRQWLQECDDYKPAILGSFGIRLEEVARIKGIVIAGRTPEKTEHARLLHSMGWDGIELLTYDDLLDGVVKLVKQIANV